MVAASAIYQGTALPPPAVLRRSVPHLVLTRPPTSHLFSRTRQPEMYGNDDGTIPATFQLINMVGWKPDPSQV